MSNHSGGPPASPDSKSKPSRWGAVAALVFAAGSDSQESSHIWYPYWWDFPPLLGEGASAVGSLGNLRLLTIMIFGPLWGFAADRFGRKKVLVLASGFWGVWIAATALAQNGTLLLILFAIGAIGTAATLPVSSSLIVDLFAEEWRGKAYGILHTLGNWAGALPYVPVYGVYLLFQSWRPAMILLGAISLVSGLLILLLVHEPEPAAGLANRTGAGRFSFEGFGSVLKTPTLLLLAAQLLLLTGAMMITLLRTFLEEMRGWENFDTIFLSTVYIVGNYAGILFTLGGGLLGDWFYQKQGSRGRVLLGQVCLGAYAVLAFLAAQINWGHSFLLYAILFCAGAVSAIPLYGVIYPMVASVADRRWSATTFALLFSLVHIGGLWMMRLLMEYLSRFFDPQTIFLWLVCLPYALNAGLWFLFYRVYPADLAHLQSRQEVG